MIIIQNKEFVKIVDSYTNKTIYRIRKSIIGETIEGKISSWVIQVYNKPWSNQNTPYDLAVVICEVVADNTIDWDATFFRVEKQRLINEALEFDDSVKDSGVEQALKLMELGQQFMADGTDAKIRQYVAEQLKLYGIK